MKKLLFIAVLVFLLPVLALASDITLRWDKVDGAVGYKLYRSTDLGSTWVEVLNTDGTSIDLTDQPDSGLVMYRVGSFNSNGETLRSWSGAWYNKDWQPPKDPSNLGIP